MNGPSQDRRLRDTLERIYAVHRQGLFTLALAVARDPDRAEDAVHEAFVRLLRTKARPSGDPVAYVFAAVRNAAIDVRRTAPAPAPGVPAPGMGGGQDADRPGGGVESIYAALPARTRGPAEAAMDAEVERCLCDAVDRLDSEDREVVVMKTYTGLTFDQMARILRQPLPTVAARYRRALDKLRSQIERQVR